MNSSSLELSAVVLDVDRTLIRSVRNYTSINPYPYYKSQHVEEYFHFTLNREPKRSNSVTLSHNNNTTNNTKSKPQPLKPLSPQTVPRSNMFSNNKSNNKYMEHYHIYIRPGLKKLFTYLSYLQSNTNVKIVIASMAKRDYINSILKGLKKHCSERKFPKFDCVLTRESWDENLSPSSTPTYPISVLLEQYAKHGFAKHINLRFKSILKIGRVLGIDSDTGISNILIVDDDMGYYDHGDRVSGQIYEIPGWNGPVQYRRHNHNDITIYTQSDNELPSLGAMIQAIVDKGSIQKYLFTRVLSVFKHEYGTKYKKQMKLRKDMMNILMNDICMDIDEDTAISSLWLFDNILRCCKNNNGNNINDNLGEYIEILFGCIIVYQMYIYDVHPSAHFYKLSFTQNEFWKQVMDVFFEYYVRLLFHIKDSRIQNKSHTSPFPYPQSNNSKYNQNSKYNKSTHSRHSKSHSRHSSIYNKFISPINNITNTNKDGNNNTNVSNTKRKSIINKSHNNKCNNNKQSLNCVNHVAPIEVAQSEPDEDIIIEAQEEIILHNKSEDDSTPTPSTCSDSIILTQETYKSIQDNLKLLVKSISKSIFCKNLSPVCFIGYNLLKPSRSNPVPKYISKYQRILKKVYRDRNIFDL